MTAEAGLQRLSIIARGRLLPSPDGSLIAVEDQEEGIFTLYDLAGDVQGRFEVSQRPMFLRWAHDSSALFLWMSDRGPLTVVERDGTTVDTGLQGIDTALGPDGTWLTGVRFGIDQDALEVVPRKGGNVRTLVTAKGLRLLGWQGEDIVYFADGGVFAVPAQGGSAKLLAPAPAGVGFQPLPPPAQTTSPDGKVLVLFTTRNLWTLAGTQLRPVPPEALLSVMIDAWTGAHSALGRSPDNDILILDMVSGAVERQTGIRVDGSIEAVSGSWLAWRLAENYNSFRLTNMDTGAQVDLGTSPKAGTIIALGRGRFLLRVQDEVYLMNP